MRFTIETLADTADPTVPARNAGRVLQRQHGVQDAG
jgi:hypothetical protein